MDIFDHSSNKRSSLNQSKHRQSVLCVDFQGKKSSWTSNFSLEFHLSSSLGSIRPRYSPVFSPVCSPSSLAPPLSFFQTMIQLAAVAPVACRCQMLLWVCLRECNYRSNLVLGPESTSRSHGERCRVKEMYKAVNGPCSSSPSTHSQSRDDELRL